jgi:hypothetical protein
VGRVVQGVGPAYRRLPGAGLDARLSPAAREDLPGLCAYFAGAGSADEALVRGRARPFAAFSLLRLAIHSWQKFKVARLARVLSLLEASS